MFPRALQLVCFQEKKKGKKKTAVGNTNIK